MVIKGRNGAGKTNLLEAISYLTVGRGMKKANLKDLQTTGTKDKWRVEANLHSDTSAKMVVTEDQSRRSTQIDGKKATRGEIMSISSVQWITPDMDFLLSNSSRSLSSFVDRMVFGIFPEKIRHVYKYEKSRRERISLLTQKNFDPTWMDKIEQEIAINGLAWLTARRNFVNLLNRRHLHQFLPKATIHIEEDKECQDEAQYKYSLQSARERDSMRRSTSFGPHLARVEVENSRLCSTGEQKRLLVSLFLENASLHKEMKPTTPVLLLDEILSHMDSESQLKIIESLEGFQTWITCTDFPHSQGRQFTCKNNGLS